MALSEGAVRQLVHRARATLRTAARAILPFPFARWAAGATHGSGVDQLSETTIGAGTAGWFGGAALKLGALVASSALATGLVSSRLGQHRPRRAARTHATSALAARGSENRAGPQLRSTITPVRSAIPTHSGPEVSGSPFANSDDRSGGEADGRSPHRASGGRDSGGGSKGGPSGGRDSASSSHGGPSGGRDPASGSNGGHGEDGGSPGGSVSPGGSAGTGGSGPGGGSAAAVKALHNPRAGATVPRAPKTDVTFLRRSALPL